MLMQCMFLIRPCKQGWLWLTSRIDPSSWWFRHHFIEKSEVKEKLHKLTKGLNYKLAFSLFAQVEVIN